MSNHVLELWTESGNTKRKSEGLANYLFRPSTEKRSYFLSSHALKHSVKVSNQTGNTRTKPDIKSSVGSRWTIKITWFERWNFSFLFLANCQNVFPPGPKSDCSHFKEFSREPLLITCFLTITQRLKHYKIARLGWINSFWSKKNWYPFDWNPSTHWAIVPPVARENSTRSLLFVMTAVNHSSATIWTCEFMSAAASQSLTYSGLFIWAAAGHSTRRRLHVHTVLLG